MTGQNETTFEWGEESHAAAAAVEKSIAAFCAECLVEADCGHVNRVGPLGEIKTYCIQITATLVETK